MAASLLGGEDMDPETNLEKIFCVFGFILGAFISAVLFGNMAFYVQSLLEESQRFVFFFLKKERSFLSTGNKYQ